MTERRMYVTGGIDSKALGVRFSYDYDLPNESAYNETSASVGLVFWSHRMLQIELDARYAEVMELANGAMSGVSLSGDTYFYANPLAVYPAEYTYQTRQKWFSTACCPSNHRLPLGGPTAIPVR